MFRSVNRIFAVVAALAIGLAVSPLYAATGTWLTTAASGDLSDAANWSGGPISAVTAGATADTLTFGTESTGATGLFQAATNDALNINFNSGASPFTWASNDNNLIIGKTATGTPNTAGAISNSSSATQIFNMGAGTLSIYGTIGGTGSGPIIINGSVTPGQNENSNVRTLTFNNTGNVYLNVDTNTLTGGTVLGGNGSAATWQATNASNNRARMIYSGTGTVYAGNIGSDYLGSQFLTGATSKLQLTGGVFAGSGGANGNSQITISGAGSSLEFNDLTGAGITFNRNNWSLSDRADLSPHVRNIAGNNTINVGTNSTATGPGDFNTSGAVDGNWNFQSDAGKLTIQGGNFYPTTDNVTSTLQLLGAGNGQIDSMLLTYSFAKMNVVKSGTGTWTLTNIPLDGSPDAFGTTIQANPTSSSSSVFKGTMTATGGRLALSGTTTLSAVSGVDVRSGSFFDVSGITSPTAGSLTLNPAQLNIKGAGTITGSLVAGTSNTFAPGDSGIGTMTISNALTLNGDGALSMELTNNPSGTNDKIAVGGNLTLGGSTTVNVTAVNGSVGNGTYKLITYAGSLLSGDATNLSLAGVTSPRQTFALDSSIAHEIDLLVGGNAASLTWVGGVNGDIWVDGTVEPNSLNWSGTVADKHFYNGDNVTFSNTGTQTVNVSGTVTPGNMNFTNNAGHDYTINDGGSASISAANMTVSGSGNTTVASGIFTVSGSITMNGTGTIEFANSGSILSLPSSIALNSGTLAVNRSDDVTVSGGLTGSGTFRKKNSNTVTLAGNNIGFTGTILIDNGRLTAGAANSLGAAAVGVTVASGTAVDVNGQKLGAKVITIAGSGPDGNGALLDLSATGTALPVRASISGIVLTADATIASSANSYPILDSTNGPASFNANGHNLTVQGYGGAGGEWDFYNAGETHLANVILKDSATYFGGTTTLGDQPGVITLQNKGALGLDGSPTVTKNIVVSSADSASGAIVSVNSNTVASQVQMDGNLEPTVVNGTNSTNPVLKLTGKLTGAGSLTVHLNATGTTSRLGTVALTSNDNDYAGPTTIGGGSGLQSGTAANDRISLSIGDGGATGMIPAGPAITMYDAATLSFNRNNTYEVSNDINTGATANKSSLTSDGTGTVTLSGGIHGGGRILVNSGTMVLTNNSNDFTGVVGIGAIGVIGSNAKLEIGSDNALGAQDGSGINSWTESNGTTATGALVLTNNINSGEYIYIAGRKTGNTAPQIINKSGNNTLSGTVSSDWSDPGSYGTGGSADDTNYAIQSDAGTLTISGNLLMQATGYWGDGGAAGQANHTTSGTGTLTFKGASNGTVSGPITELDSNWHWNIVKDGAGTWELSSNTNSYTGSTAVNSGLLRIDNPDLADVADVYLKTGGTLNLTFSDTDTIDSLFINNVPQATGTWGAIGSGADHETSLITGTGKLLVSTLATIPGDYNSDGKVNAADFVTWRKDPTNHGGDPAGYADWRQNFSQTASSGPGLGSAAAVPEPASCALVLCALSVLFSSRSRRVARATR